MECWSKIVVRKANIIYPAENFYCAGIVMPEAFGKFRNTPPRVTNDVRARRREPQMPQTAACGSEVKSQYR